PHQSLEHCLYPSRSVPRDQSTVREERIAPLQKGGLGSALMLKIRKGQMEALEQATFERFVRRLMEQVRAKYADRVPRLDTELRESVTAWITDARRWGFTTDSAITRYVDLCAQTQGQREPIETRLKTYLRLYHENLLS